MTAKPEKPTNQEYFENRGWCHHVREMIIELEKQIYEPGELIEGKIIVNCDESFEFNDIHVSLYGKEHT